MNYIYSNICHGTSLKKPFWQRGDSNQRRRYQKSTDMLYPLGHHASPKKDASSPELSNTVFSHSSNVNSHIMTDANFVM